MFVSMAVAALFTVGSPTEAVRDSIRANSLRRELTQLRTVPS